MKKEIAKNTNFVATAEKEKWNLTKGEKKPVKKANIGTTSRGEKWNLAQIWGGKCQNHQFEAKSWRKNGIWRNLKCWNHQEYHIQSCKQRNRRKSDLWKTFECQTTDFESHEIKIWRKSQLLEKQKWTKFIKLNRLKLKIWRKSQLLEKQKWTKFIKLNSLKFKSWRKNQFLKYQK